MDPALEMKFIGLYEMIGHHNEVPKITQIETANLIGYNHDIKPIRLQETQIESQCSCCLQKL